MWLRSISRPPDPSCVSGNIRCIKIPVSVITSVHLHLCGRRRSGVMLLVSYVCGPRSRNQQNKEHCLEKNNIWSPWLGSAINTTMRFSSFCVTASSLVAERRRSPHNEKYFLSGQNNLARPISRFPSSGKSVLEKPQSESLSRQR